MCTGLVLVQSPKSQGTDMTGPVVTRRDRSVRHIRRADKADFTVICIVGGCRNLLWLFFSLNRRIGPGTLGRIGIAVAIPSTATPATSASISPSGAGGVWLSRLICASSSTSTTTTVLTLRSGGSLGRLGVGHLGGNWSGSGRVSQATRSEDGTNSVQEKGVVWDRIIEPKALLACVFTRCDNSSFVVANLVEGRFSFQGGGGQAAREC